MKILIVDDSRMKSDRLKACVLEMESDAIVFQASSAVEGMDKLKSIGVDLVFLDVMLPFRDNEDANTDGSIWFLREVKRKLGAASAPLIVGTTEYPDSIGEASEKFRDSLWSIITVKEDVDAWRSVVEYSLQFSRRALYRAFGESPSEDSVDIAILTALRIPEFEAVVAAIGGGDKIVIRETGEYWMRSALVAKDGRTINVLAACADEMGMAAMAALVTRVSILARPRVVYLCGIMGGNRERLSIADLVACEESWDFRAGKLTKDGFVPDVRSHRCNQILINNIRDACREELLLKLWQVWKGEKPRHPPVLHGGAVACSPAVIARSEIFQEIEQQKRKVFGIEMEGFGCYEAASRLGKMAPAVLCIKSVSDLGDDQKSDIYQKYCAYLAAEVVLAGIRNSEPWPT